MSDHPLPNQIARGAAFTVIALLLGSWLVGAVLFVQGIYTDLDAVLGYVYFNGWTPADVRGAAEAGGFHPSLGAWMWLAEEVVITAAFGGAGLLLFFRKRDGFGLFLSVTLVAIGTSITGPVLEALTRAIPLSIYITRTLTSITPALFLFLLFILPDGRFAPRWMRWPSILMLAGAASTILMSSYGVIEQEPSLVFNAFGVVGILSQLYRYGWVSGPKERQQMRWIVAALSLFVIYIFLVFWLPFLNDGQPAPPPGQVIGFGLAYWGATIISILFVVALLHAVTRHELWNLEFVIRRTLQYGVISAILAAVYFGSIVVVQAAFRSLTGTESSLGVVLSTLLIAALFQPVREQVQQVVDRRFFRRRYDAEQTLAQFADAMRDEVDLDEIKAQLLSTVAHTLEPEHVSLIMVQEADDG